MGVCRSVDLGYPSLVWVFGESQTKCRSRSLQGPSERSGGPCHSGPYDHSRWSVSWPSRTPSDSALTCGYMANCGVILYAPESGEISRSVVTLRVTIRPRRVVISARRVAFIGNMSKPAGQSVRKLYLPGVYATTRRNPSPRRQSARRWSSVRAARAAAQAAV